MKYPINVYNIKDSVFVRYFDGKEKKHEEIPFEAHLFVKSDVGDRYHYHGHPLKTVIFDSKDDYVKAVKSAKSVKGMYHGCERPIYDIMYRLKDWPKDEIYNYTYAVFDIEVESTSEGGFPDPNRAEVPINAISYLFGKKVWLFYYYDYDLNLPEEIDDYEVEVVKVLDETDLLMSFFETIRDTDPDVIGGWNTEGFDWQYILTRSRKIGIRIGDIGKTISPFGKVSTWRSGNKTRFTIVGRSNIDYLLIYKKLIVSPRSNYTLDEIARVELGAGKHQVPEGIKGWELWRYDKYLDDFFRYSIIDVIRVDQIMKVSGLYDLMSMVSNFAVCNIEDNEYTSRVWIALINSFLRDRGFVPEIGTNDGNGNSGDQIVGAYVKDPVPGLYEGVMSYDVTSLYPSIMMSLNISPDVFVEKDDFQCCKAANGACFRKDIEGFFVTILKSLFKQRQDAKKKMLGAKKSKDEDKAKYYKVIQSALKVLLNSAYGCMASKYFPYYHKDMAEAVTTTGQVVVRVMERAINKAMEERGVDEAVVYCDTDSAYFLTGVDPNRSDFIDVSLQICDEVVDKYVRAYFEKMAFDKFRARENHFSAKHEKVISKVVFCSKKKYAGFTVWDEGVIYEEPKLFMVGLEGKKPSHASLARKYLKDLYKRVLDGGSADYDYVQFVKSEWDKAHPDEITNIVYVNSKNGGTWIAANNYNNLMDKGVIPNSYRKIQVGDKIHFCHCVDKNRFGIDTVAWIDYPEELDMIIDRDKQFDVCWVSPANIFLEAVGKRVEIRRNIDELF